MKTVVVQSFRSHPNPERLRLTMHDAGAEDAVISVDDRAVVPTFDFPVTVVRHSELPWRGAVKVVKYMNELMAPLAKAAVTKHPDADAFLYLHDDTAPDPTIFSNLLSLLNRFHFASGQQHMCQTPGVDPFPCGNTDRLVAWRAASFAKYVTRDYPEEGPVGFDSMDYIMKWMDDEGDKYIWTNLKPDQVQL